jgi:fibronectin-binding autotransporter adhesin
MLGNATFRGFDMKTKILALLCPALIVGVQITDGGVTLELIDRGVPSNGSIAATGYTGYTLRLVSDAGNIGAVDFSSRDFGIYAPLVQRWLSTDENGIYDSPTPGYIAGQNLLPAITNFDSHFLPPGPTLEVVSRWEDASFGLVGSQLGSFPENSMAVGYGLGTRLHGGYGIIGGSQSKILDLAYLVIPNNGTIEIRGEAAASAGFGPFEISSAPTWTGAGNEWNTDASNMNWRKWGNAVAFYDGDDVQFTDAGLSGGGVVQIPAGGVAPRHVSINTTGGSYVFTGGPINSSGRIRKIRPGSVTFNSPATFAGTALFGNGSEIRINSTFTSARLTVGMATLTGNGTIIGGLNISGNHVIAPGGFDSIGTLSTNRLSISGVGSILFDISASATDRFNVTSADGLVIPSNTPTDIYLSRMGDLPAGSYPLIHYTGQPLSSIDRLQLQTRGIGGWDAKLVNNQADRTVDVLLARGSTWKGNGGGRWERDYYWSNGVPDEIGFPVTFGPSLIGPAEIRVPYKQDGSRYVVGSMLFDSPISYELSAYPYGIYGTYLVLKAPQSQNALVRVVRGNHSISCGLDLASDTTIDIAANLQLTIGGLLDSSALTKTGAGTLKLQSGSISFYFGTIAVQQGTLITDMWSNSTGTSTVASGATLGGAGHFNGPVTLAPGARIAPGESTNEGKTLTVGGLSLDSALLDFDLTSSGADKIVVTGANKLLLEGVSTINISLAESINAGAYPLIDYSGQPLTDLGQLALGGLPNGAAVTLSYNSTNTSIDLVVSGSLVPEPVSVSLLLTTSLLTLQRRRKSGGMT